MASNTTSTLPNVSRQDSILAAAKHILTDPDIGQYFLGTHDD